MSSRICSYQENFDKILHDGLQDVLQDHIEIKVIDAIILSLPHALGQTQEFLQSCGPIVFGNFGVFSRSFSHYMII